MHTRSSPFCVSVGAGAGAGSASGEEEKGGEIEEKVARKRARPRPASASGDYARARPSLDGDSLLAHEAVAELRSELRSTVYSKDVKTYRSNFTNLYHRVQASLQASNQGERPTSHEVIVATPGLTLGEQFHHMPASLQISQTFITSDTERRLIERGRSFLRCRGKEIKQFQLRARTGTMSAFMEGCQGKCDPKKDCTCDHKLNKPWFPSSNHKPLLTLHALEEFIELRERKGRVAHLLTVNMHAVNQAGE